MFTDLAEFHRWLAERHEKGEYRVTPAPLDRLEGWSVDPVTGDLRHDSGGFFTVHGLEVTGSQREVGHWQQPVIDQPEHGVLGILVKEFHGVPHCLLQAKMEPGNINTLQLSPTVQATRSNYTRVHRGRAVPYLELFITRGHGRPLADALQSEQGSWFLAKRNRNIIVQIDEDIPVLEDFCWLSIDQIGQLLTVHDLVNMDTRTVLSHLPPALLPGAERFRGPAPRPLAELLNWLTHHKTADRTERRSLPLAKTEGWRLTDGELRHEHDRYFRIVGVDVRAGNREVTGWSQPMLAPRGEGVVAFLVRHVDGVAHVLVQARAEAGTPDRVEIAPTVQCNPGNHAHQPGGRRPRYLDTVQDAPRDRVLFDVVHSEEGGRFHHARNRYLAVDVTDDPAVTEVDGFHWTACGRLAEINQYGGLLNVEARNLLTCLGFVA
ncbi:NDP-hexose 2,3-dehydratase family protein [Streptomyces sp. NPDC127039]|uniref:NDP-hexose 2,3-dehydratase family protein n=1 Tax=Streptomyces sp. NPDC127039 TaxID=3347115 RepID=UPI0036529EF7